MDIEHELFDQKAYTKLVALQKVSTSLLSANTLKKIGEITINGGFSVIGAVSGDLILLSKDKTTYELLAYKGYPQSFLKKFPHLSLKTPVLTNYVIQTKKPYFIQNSDDLDPKYKIAKTFLKLCNATAAALFPLKIDSDVIGILQFVFKDSQSFSIENQKFMRILANQCTQAIDRVLRLHNLKEAKKELEAILKRFP
jgi:transcriptional regulator with GAF, ATPase, and Fis domain